MSFEHQVWAFGVQRKRETHFETEVTLCSRCSETAWYSERCSRNFEHQVCAFDVQGKRVTYFETEVTLCSRCSETAWTKQRCSRNCEHQVWVFNVRWKKEAHFEAEDTLCLRCSETARTQGRVFKKPWTPSMGIQYSGKKKEPLWNRGHLLFEVFRHCLTPLKGVQGTMNTKYGRSLFKEKERPTLKQVQGVQRLPEHIERCSGNFEHQVRAFGVRGKRETHFES